MVCLPMSRFPMVDAPHLIQFQVGDRVKLVRGVMRGHKATVSKVDPEGYWLLGDWTKQTGFTQVLYGPVDSSWLQGVG